MLEMNTKLMSLVFSHRCQITSGRSVGATCPCATGAATAARATRAAVSAASSEDSRNGHKILIYSAFYLTPRNDLFLNSFSNALSVLYCFFFLKV